MASAALPERMRAVVVPRPGAEARVELCDVLVPSPGPGQVLIRVAFVAVNWSDVQKRQGIYPDPVSYPAVLGAEVSGRIVAVGPGVPRRLLGTVTAALCGPRLVGGGAEYVVVDRAYLVPVPADLGLAAAAAMPLAAMTAYHLLHTAHRLRRGEVVLIHAAAGSVGLAVIQLARMGGARVIGTVGSAAKAEPAHRYGADLVVDRSSEDFVAAALEFSDGKGVDLVIDSLGGQILPRSFDALRHYGRLINIGEAAGEPDFPVRKKLYERSTSMAGFEVLHAAPGSPRWQRGLRHVHAAVVQGQLTIPIHRVLELGEVNEAHAVLESRASSGKILLKAGGTGS